MADETQAAAAAPPPTPDMEGRTEALLRLADGRTLKMRCDQRAAFRVQRETGRSIYAHIDAVIPNARELAGTRVTLDPLGVDMTEVIELAFYLTASHRRQLGLDEMTFEEFLDLLPMPSVAQQTKLMSDVLGVVYGTMAAGNSKGEAPTSGNADAPAEVPPAETLDGSTGGDEATSAE